MRSAIRSANTPWIGYRKSPGFPKKEIQAAARFLRAKQTRRDTLGLPIDSTPGITPAAQAITASGASQAIWRCPRKRYCKKRLRMRFLCLARSRRNHPAGFERDGPAADRHRQIRAFPKFIWRTQTDTVLDQIFPEKTIPDKSLWMQTGNLIAGIGFEPKKWSEAFRKLDFIAAVDLFMTPTTQYADVVLPAATFLEKESVRSWWFLCQTINKAISVEGCRPDVEINFELARRFDPNLRWKSVEALFDSILQNSGMSFRKLQKKGWMLPPEGNSSAPYRRHEKGLLRKDAIPDLRPPPARSSSTLFSVKNGIWSRFLTMKSRHSLQSADRILRKNIL